MSLTWAIEYTETAKRELKRLDKPAAKRLLDFMDERIGRLEDPRTVGKALSGPLGTLWRYRIGDYRAICEIQHSRSTVLVVHIGHRREVYR